jgi:hypothetical protein
MLSPVSAAAAAAPKLLQARSNTNVQKPDPPEEIGLGQRQPESDKGGEMEGTG